MEAVFVDLFVWILHPNGVITFKNGNYPPIDYIPGQAEYHEQLLFWRKHYNSPTFPSKMG